MPKKRAGGSASASSRGADGDDINSLLGHISDLQARRGHRTEFLTFAERLDRTDDTPPADRRLDAIARMITGGDICSAVYFDGENFIISNNTKNPRLTADFFKSVKDILIPSAETPGEESEAVSSEDTLDQKKKI